MSQSDAPGKAVGFPAYRQAGKALERGFFEDGEPSSVENGVFSYA